MYVLGLFEISSVAAARRRDGELHRLRHAATTFGSPPPIVHELILIADRIADLAAAPSREPADTAELLAWLHGRIEALLASCEVATVVDAGAVDFLRHEVVADRAAPSGELVDHIAATVRPGYRWRDNVLRAQQVVAYVDAEP